MAEVKAKIISVEEFKEFFEHTSHRYNSTAFNELNEKKVEKVTYLAFQKNNKTRTGICLGIKEGTAFSPFSSPFGGLCLTRPNLSIDHYCDAVKSLIEFAENENLKAIHITLPPEIYTESSVNEQLNALTQSGFEMSSVDLNHSFNLRDFGPNYIDKLSSDARRNMKLSFNSDLSFVRCQTSKEIEEAYDVIRINRAEKSYPLHMTLADIVETAEVISVDYFVARDKEMRINAAAIVFHPTGSVAQVVYWGDLSSYKQNRPMYFLAYKLFEYYTNKKEIIDIGPSSKNGVPNIGLCNFKQSLGCKVHSKFSLTYQL